jgi:hypothetical protein
LQMTLRSSPTTPTTNRYCRTWPSMHSPGVLCSPSPNPSG